MLVKFQFHGISIQRDITPLKFFFTWEHLYNKRQLADDKIPVVRKFWQLRTSLFIVAIVKLAQVSPLLASCIEYHNWEGDYIIITGNNHRPKSVWIDFALHASLQRTRS